MFGDGFEQFVDLGGGCLFKTLRTLPKPTHAMDLKSVEAMNSDVCLANVYLLYTRKKAFKVPVLS